MSDEEKEMKSQSSQINIGYQQISREGTNLYEYRETIQKVNSIKKRITGLLIVFILLIALVVIAFFSIKTTINQALASSQQHEQQLERTTQSILEVLTKNNIKTKGEKVVLPIDVPIGPNIKEIYYKHAPSTFTYPTIGIPEPGKMFNDTLVEQKDLAEFGRIFNDLMKPYNDTNCRLQKYGQWESTWEDGAYVVCDNLFTQTYAMINIGMNGYDTGGCEIVKRHPILNYQYDCVNSVPPVCDRDSSYLENDKAKSLFQKKCLGQKTEKTGFGTFLTLDDMVKSHNLTDKHIILKIDCQGCQYDGLKYVPTSLLDNVDIIFGELHFGKINAERWGYLDIFRTLSEKFVNVNYHVAWWLCYKQDELKLRQIPGMAVQVTLVNRKLINLASNSRSFQLHPSNFPGCAPQGMIIPRK